MAEGGDEDVVPDRRMDEELALGRADGLTVEHKADDPAHCSIVTGSPSGANVSGQ